MNERLDWQRREDLESQDLECMFVQVFLKQSKSILFCVMYRPPDSSTYLPDNFKILLLEQLTRSTISNSEMFIMGDFNIDFLEPNNHRDIKTLLSQWGFYQTMKQATRTSDTSSTLIDLLFTNKPNNISKTLVIPITFSDHDLIRCVRKLNWEKHAPKEIKCRDNKHYSKELFCGKLKNADWQNVLTATNVNAAWKSMREIIRSCLDSIAPVITKRIRGKPCPWMTPDLKQQMAERDRLQRRYRKSKLPVHKVEYNQRRNSVKNLVKKAKQEYFKNLLSSSAQNPNSFWRNLKKIYPSKQKDTPKRFNIHSTTTTDTKIIANAFCSFFCSTINTLKTKAFVLIDFVWRRQTFESLRTCKNFTFKQVTEKTVHSELRKLKRKKSTGIDDIPPSVLKDAANVLAKPLTRIINLSLQTGVFPTDWKVSKITPIHKSNAIDCIENYRPISVIPSISKIIERVTHSQLSEYLESNNLISDCQFGFRKRRSTELATALFTDNIKKKVNEGKLVGSIFLDQTKAFDALSHAKLISKMRCYGILNKELEWFKDYLFDRTQYVQRGTILSDAGKVRSGVPQGSIIGPILFTLFYNDLPSCLKHSEVIIYADDTVIFVPGKDVEIIEARLSADMKRVYEWCTDNELILNLHKGKTESMLFGTSKNLSQQPSVLNISFGDKTVNFTTKYKYLGCIIEPSLNMNSHFENSYKKASNRLRLLCKLRPYMTADACSMLYKSMVMPILTYCGILHLNKAQTLINKSNALHERVCRILGSDKSLSIKSPETIIRSRALVTVRKCIEGDMCNNFRSYFEIHQHTKSTRNSGTLLKLPNLKLEFFRGSFCYSGAKLYNELPRETRQLDILKFKTHV